MLPSLLLNKEFKDTYGYSRQDFFSIRDKFIIPAMRGSEPYVLDHDGITSFWMMKLRQNPSYRLAEIQYGLSSSQLTTIFWRITEYVYANSRFCRRNRNLANPANLNEVLEECRNATVNHGTIFPIVEKLRIALGHHNRRSVILIHDTRDLKMMKTTDLHKQKSSWSSKSKANAMKKIQVASVDGRVAFIYCLSYTISPRNNDERAYKNIVDMETVGGIAGGLKAIFEETPGWFKFHLLGRGYEGFNIPNGQAFFDYLDNVRRNSGNAVIYSYPNSPGKSYMDFNANIIAPPANLPPRVMSEEMCNLSEMLCTICRGAVEQSFLADWRFKICGSRGPVPQQLLEAWERNPTPQVSKIFVILMVCAAVEKEYGVPFQLKFELPPGISYQDHGRNLIRRCEILNWLDKFRTGGPGNGFNLNRPFPFSRPTPLQLAQGQLGRFGGVRNVNGMRPAQTGFPRLTLGDLTEIAGGSYGPRNADMYITGIKELQVQRHHYTTLRRYTRRVGRVMNSKSVTIFDQINAPAGWNGPWNTGRIPWTPCRIVRVSGIPSAHGGGKYYTTLVAYALNGQPSPNPYGYSNQNLGKLLMWCCGPRGANSCKQGPRTATPCIHVLSTIKLLGVIAHAPHLHRARFHNLNAVDAGDQLPAQHFFDVVNGTVH